MGNPRGDGMGCAGIVAAMVLTIGPATPPALAQPHVDHVRVEPAIPADDCASCCSVTKRGHAGACPASCATASG